MATLFVDKIDPQSGTSLEIGSSGDTISVPSGATINLSNATQTGVGGTNTPAFEAEVSSDQVPSNNTDTKIQFNNEIYDTNNAYDNSSNYRFTPQTAGKYFAYTKVRCQSSSTSQLADAGLKIRKNGADVVETFTLFRNNYEQAHTVATYSVIDMNGSSDYLEVYGKIRVASGNVAGFIGGSRRSTFGAYKIIE